MSGKPKTRENFIADARKIHGDKYDYSLVVYKNSRILVCIICPIHGPFWQRPDLHLSGKGCKDCAREGRRKSNEQFIAEAKAVHGDKYGYGKTRYKNKRTKVVVTCPIHGDFEIRPDKLLDGHGCMECGKISKNKKQSKTLEQFVEEARKIHGDRYDYSLVDYINSYTEVKIICRKHGVFLQRPDVHLRGCGCPFCNQSTLENQTALFLNKLDINFIQQCSGKELQWLGRQMLDFYIPDLNIAIECQGVQHFKPIEYFGGEKEFGKIVERDQRKARLCEEEGVRLFYIRYDEDVEEVLTNILTETGIIPVFNNT